MAKLRTAQEANAKIDALIRGRAPLIVITTREEMRVLDALKEIAVAQQHDGRGKTVVDWSIAAGLSVIEGDDSQVTPAILQGSNMPDAAIKKIAAFPAGRFIFILKDLHPYLNNPQVVRGLKEAATGAMSKGHAVILLSPHFTTPPELDTLATVVDYPLPTAKEILADIAALVDSLSARGKVKVELNDGQDDVKRLAQALTGLTKDEAMGVLRQAIILNAGVLNLAAMDAILDEKRNIVGKAGTLTYYDPEANYGDVGGLVELKRWLKEAELTFTDEAQAFGLEPVRGVLIGGIPGTGKSLTAKACAGGRHPRPLLRLSVSEVLAAGGGIVGQGQAKLHQALKVVESIGNCVLWIDEIEKGLGSSGGEMDGGTRRDILGDFLTWMQESTAPVFIVATANDVLGLPAELIRRFDEKFFLDIPGPRARREIVAIHLGKRGRDPEAFEMDELVRAAKGYTGAEIEQAVKAALRKAFSEGADDVTTGHIVQAIAEIKPMSETMAGKLRAYRAWDARPADGADPEEESSPNQSFDGLEF